MPPAASEVRREDLLAWLRAEGHPVSNHQLLRWVDAGLLPKPRRKGKGRGRGTEVYYPALAYLQARTLLRLLRANRNLDEAGWGLWALGFPLTEWARALMLDELEQRRREFERVDRRVRRGRGSPLVAAGRRQPPRQVATMRKAVAAKRMPTVLQMGLQFSLGTLKAGAYTTEDWEAYQDATVQEFFPALLGDLDLPLPHEFAPELEKVSHDFSLSRTIRALKTVEGPRLELYRNELQWLTEEFATPEARPTAIMARSSFVLFLGRRHLIPDADKQLGTFMRTLGRSAPPLSALQRWVMELARKSAIPSPTP